MPDTVETLLRHINKDLATQNSTDKPTSYDAALLLSHVLNRSTTALRTWPDHLVSAFEKNHFMQLWSRRLKGEPIAYLLGQAPFRDFSLFVTPDTLIPRPETEEVVTWILTQFSSQTAYSVLDLGTGSGAIALALARERPAWKITATDYAEPALRLAKKNAAALHIDSIAWYQGNWFSALPDTTHFDLIVSNPPYIAPDDPHLQQHGLSYEPQSALVAEKEGYADIEHLIAEAPRYLHPQGWLVLEHGYTQGEKVRDLFEAQSYQAIHTHRDYGGQERFTVGVKV